MAYDLQTRAMWKWGVQSFRDELLGPYEGWSIWQWCPLSVLQMDPSVGHVFKDDFEFIDTTLKWALDEDAGKTGPDVVLDEKGGWYRHYTDGTDNDLSALATTFPIFGLVAGKPLWFEARIRLTEENTDKANYAIGLSVTADKTFMQDDGAGPLANNDHIVWYKRDANMFLEFETSLAAAQTVRADVLAHVTAHVYRVGFYCKPASATTFTVYPFWYDETAAAAAGPTFSTALACTLTLTGWGPAKAFFCVGAGETDEVNEEHIDIDYLKIVQAR